LTYIYIYIYTIFLNLKPCGNISRNITKLNGMHDITVPSKTLDVLIVFVTLSRNGLDFINKNGCIKPFAMGT
jgi:hypothetical protein